MNSSISAIKPCWTILICVSFIFFSCVESQEKQLERLVASGNQAFANYQYKDAASHWQEAVRLAPDDAMIHEKLGHACLRLARFNDAERHFRTAVELAPETWTAWIEIGKLSVLSLDLHGGEDVWEMLKTNRIHNPHTLIYHGDLAMLKNEFNEAELDYRQALAIAPERADGMIKLAISLQVQKKDAEAETVFKRLAVKEIDDPLVLIQMGHYWNLVDDFPKAEKYMKAALELDPADLRVQIRVANFYTAAGRYDAAAVILEPILGDSSLAVAKEYANLLIQQEKIKETIAFLKPLLGRHPNDDTLKLMMGKCHLLTGNAVIAANEINAVAEKHRDSPSVHYLLGIAYLAGGYNQMGMQHLTTALTLDNSFSDAELALASCYYRTGAYALAHQYAQRFIENNPGDFRPHMIAGAAYMEEGDPLQAKQSFAMAVRLNPASMAPRYFSALADETSGKTRQAADRYKRLLAEYPIRIDVAERYKTFLINNGQEDTARRFFEALAADHPDDAYYLYMLAEFYLSVDKPKIAADGFRRVIEAQPDFILAYIQLADLQEKDNDLTAAVDTLKNGITVNPTFSEGMCKLAQLHLALGDTRNAVAVLESAYAMNRNDATIINNLASLYLEDNVKMIRAFELAQKAYEKNNTDPAYLDTLGWAYYKKKLYPQAVWYLREAEKKLVRKVSGMRADDKKAFSKADRENVSIIRYHLGMALVRKGKKQMGVEKLKRSIEFGLDGPMRDSALTVIEEAKRS